MRWADEDYHLNVISLHCDFISGLVTTPCSMAAVALFVYQNLLYQEIVTAEQAFVALPFI